MLKRIFLGVIVLLLVIFFVGVFRVKLDEKKIDSILLKIKSFDNFKKLIVDV